MRVTERIGGIDAEVGVEARLPNREPDSALLWKTFGKSPSPYCHLRLCLLVQLLTIVRAESCLRH